MITDSQELQATVLARVADSLLLQAEVYGYRIADAVELQAAVVPALSDSVQLRATVINREFEEAAAGRVLAPEAEITFTRRQPQ